MPTKSDVSKLNVLLVEDDPDYAALVQEWLSSAQTGPKFLLAWADSVRSAVDRLAKGDINVVLLDLSLPDSEGIETFHALNFLCTAVPIIILSAASSESLALQTISQGAEDYLVKSTCTADLLARALSYAARRRQRETEVQLPAGAAKHNRVVAMLGAKGGTGATTAACTLAAELRDLSQGPTLLADLDPHSGLVGFLLGLESRYSILQATQSLDRLDRTIWQSLVSDADGVDVIHSPAPASATEVDPASLSRVVGFATRSYEWVVLDLGRLNACNAKLLATLKHTAETIVVTTNSISSLYAAKRTVEALRANGVDLGHVGVIINQADEAGEGLPSTDLIELFGVQLYARLPYEREELRNALIDKRLPADSSRFRLGLKNVARKLAGLEDVKPKRTIPGLLSFLTKRSSQTAAASEVK